MPQTEFAADIQFEQCGGMNIIQPLTKDGLHWVQSHLNFEAWQVVGATAVAVDRCAVDDLRKSATDDGLTVR